MPISHLIRHLEALRQCHGDIPVVGRDSLELSTYDIDTVDGCGQVVRYDEVIEGGLAVCAVRIGKHTTNDDQEV